MRRAVTTVAAALAVAGAGLGTATHAAARTVWLCRPGLAHSECTQSLTATVVSASGAKRVEHARAARNPAIDCFYVYPTASVQPTINARLVPDAGVTNTVRSQLSRFTQVCRAYAPLYRQITLVGLGKLGTLTPAQRAHASAVAYDDVLAAWKEYLRRDNHGRGVVLVGHSQGAGILRRLIASQIDPHPALRRRLVSAILLGGNVVVPSGRRVGGDFKHVPACTRGGETGCVIAYSSFLETPPANALFGRPTSTFGGPSGKGYEVLCVNPARLDGSGGWLDPYFTVNGASGLLGGLGTVLGIGTPWVSYPHLYRASCRTGNGATWLQVTPVGKPNGRVLMTERLGPTWGLHLFDVGAAWGNLVSIVRREAAAYARAHGGPSFTG